MSGFLKKGFICKALALDLDGTLTNGAKLLTERTRAAVCAAARRGIAIILASGRPLIGIQKLAHALGLYEQGGYILAYNGGQIIDCKADRVIFQRLLPRKFVPLICEAARQFGVHALTYDESAVIAETSDAPYVVKEAFNNGITIRPVARLEDALTVDAVKFMIVGEPHDVAPAAEYLREKTRGEINIFFSEPFFMEITAPGIEKATALAHLMEHIGITQAELCAIGDGLNDLSMLQYAGFAVAMGNAYDEIKRVADHVTATNDADGVAVFVEEMLK